MIIIKINNINVIYIANILCKFVRRLWNINHWLVKKSVTRWRLRSADQSHCLTRWALLCGCLRNNNVRTAGCNYRAQLWEQLINGDWFTACISQHLHALTRIAWHILGLTNALPPCQQVLHSFWSLSAPLGGPESVNWSPHSCKSELQLRYL